MWLYSVKFKPGTKWFSNGGVCRKLRTYCTEKRQILGPRIADLLNRNSKYTFGDTVEINGWIRGIRDQKETTFLDINDGSTLAHLQVVLPTASFDQNLSFGSSVHITGKLTPGGGKQTLELVPASITLIGNAHHQNPLAQNQRASLEFLREVAHLRPRTNFFGSLLRLRNVATMSFHHFLQKQGFIQIHTPIITSNDCEGAGQVFKVVSNDKPKEGKHYKFTGELCVEYFGTPAFLTVSGQLHAEMMACSLSRVYTLGPTFRAEGSDTPRHLAEFTMLEPEMAFCTMENCMDLIEELIKSSLNTLREECQQELQFFQKRVEANASLLDRLNHTVSSKFLRVSYTEAIQLLQKAPKDSFKFPVHYGVDLQREHEKYLCDKFNLPLFITDWPKEIKPFYMRQNDDAKTVAALDLLVPGVGEIVGGSVREERYEQLVQAMKHASLMEKDTYDWYLDLRRYGTVPHAGFGLGFERFIQFATGIKNIKDVIPIPRAQGACKY